MSVGVVIGISEVCDVILKREHYALNQKEKWMGDPRHRRGGATNRGPHRKC